MYEHIKNLDFKKMLINVVINVALIATFIAIFYFTYVVTEEKQIFNKQVDIITTDIISYIKPFLTQKDINNIINKLKVPDTTQQDNQIIVYNNNLKNDAIKKILIVFSVCMIIGYFICHNYNYNFIDYLKYNLLLLIIIGLTEFSFLHMIASKFISGDPNYVKYKIFTNVKNKIEITD